jgi:hypothetical protein
MLPWKHRGKLLTLMIRLVRSLSHPFMRTFNGSVGATEKRAQTMATYRRPDFQGSIENPPRNADGNLPTESLSEMLGQVSENSVGQIDDLVGEFQRLREKLRSDGERIQREIEEYSRLSEQVMQLTKTISESVEKVRACGGSTAH